MNKQDPCCRDAFIAAMEASEINAPLDFVEGDNYPSGWMFKSVNVVTAYKVWCLLWHPPRDADPESVLGKLHDDVKNGIGTIAVLVSMDDAAAIIHLIESQAARIEELDESVDAFIRRDKTQCDEISRMRMEAEQ